MTAMTPWTQTATGGRIDIINPKVGQFKLADIAHQLARINRFSGAIKWEFYSVAQHSVLCARAAKVLGYPLRVQIWALLHDAHEICINDISSPAKQAIKACVSNGQDPVAMIEGELDSAVWVSLFGLFSRQPNEFERQMVKRIDAWMLGNEAAQVLRGGPRADWDFVPPPFPELEGKFPIRNGWRPLKAAGEFRATFRKLTGLD